jgi:hypothetical protein
MRRHAALHSFLAPVAALTAAAMLSACGAVAGGGAAIGTRAITVPASSFVRQARADIARWDRSRAARLWRTGLVLTGPDEQVVQIPDNAGFDSERQKDMFWSGHFRLATTLPSRSPGDVVRWTGGAAQRFPVQDARAAFAALSTQTPCGGPYRCSSLGDLSVVSMRPTTVAMFTSRGLAEIPAWQFRVAELPWAFTQLAVVPSALLILPFDYGAEVGDLLAVSPDGRQLTLVAEVGYCSGAPKPRFTGQAYETAGAVVVGARATAVPAQGGDCAGVGLRVQFHATLARPLGSRVVLDVGSGQPLALGSGLP